MIESIHFGLPALFSGMLLGLIYFGGLWLSIRRFLARENAMLWFQISLMLRNLIALCGFYLIMDGDWQKLIAAVVGFSVVRIVLSRRVGRSLGSSA
jgi:F1F0 ATPase subunit 2